MKVQAHLPEVSHMSARAADVRLQNLCKIAAIGAGLWNCEERYNICEKWKRKRANTRNMQVSSK